MRTHAIIVALFAAALATPVAAGAQEPAARWVTSVSSRGMLGFYSEPVPGAPLHQRVIVDVIAESPAAKAGLQKGDTLVRINGLAASPQVMSAPFEPGDTVILRVRRDGRDRDFTVIAAERSTQAYSVTLPDSVNRQFAIYMDRMRTSVDTIRGLPGITMRRMAGDSSTVIVIGGDTVRIATRGGFIGVHPDSIRTIYSRDLPGMFSDSGRFRVFSDSAMVRMFGDSTRWQMFSDSTRFRMFSEPGRSHVFGDSAGIRIFTQGEGRIFSFGGDSNVVRGFDMLASNAVYGMRAVAGAEMAPLNPALSEYFGATEGVLVLNAADRTPAERAGLRGGDVIVRVGDTAVHSVADVRRAIERAPAGDVRLRVLRHGRNVDVTLRR
ncbi:MAG: PDZ domain-containing protein [Gemmatimonadetes bacterium]|nr:PDZ domain-containing protein [Gemmatimonadota bacterium]